MEPKADQDSFLQLSVRVVGGEKIDATDLDALTRSLCRELEEIPAVSRVSLEQAHEPGPGGKGVAKELGKLLLEVAPKTVGQALEFLKEWVQRAGSRPVEIEAKGKAGITVRFDPRTLTADDVQKLAVALQATVDE